MNPNNLTQLELLIKSHFDNLNTISELINNKKNENKVKIQKELSKNSLELVLYNTLKSNEEKIEKIEKIKILKKEKAYEEEIKISKPKKLNKKTQIQNEANNRIEVLNKKSKELQIDIDEQITHNNKYTEINNKYSTFNFNYPCIKENEELNVEYNKNFKKEISKITRENYNTKEGVEYYTKIINKITNKLQICKNDAEIDTIKKTVEKEIEIEIDKVNCDHLTNYQLPEKLNYNSNTDYTDDICKEIEKLYKIESREIHPDKNPECISEATNAIQILNEEFSNIKVKCDINREIANINKIK